MTGSAHARAVIAIGNPLRERVVLQAFADIAEHGAGLRVVRRCLDANDLLASIQDGEADLAVVSAELHGLGVDAVHQLAQTHVPLLLWGTSSASSSEALRGAPVTILPADAELGELRASLETMVRIGGRLRRPAFPASAQSLLVEAEVRRAAGIVRPPVQDTSVAGTILALVGAPGGQGVSTVSAGLAAGLDRLASVALVDLNLLLPTLALALDLNPARNLYMVLHEAGTRNDPDLWFRLLNAELQSLDPECPHGVVLAGVPDASLGHAIESDHIRRLLRQLAQHQRFVVADVGSELDPRSSVGAAHRAAIEVADRVLVVARADVVGLRRAAALLETLRKIVDHPEDRLALILNRHQPRHHHDAVEVSRALRTNVAAVIPDDPGTVHAALAAQRPMVAFGGTPRGSAAQALVQLARSVQGAAPSEIPRVDSGQRGLHVAWPARFRPFTTLWRRP